MLTLVVPHRVEWFDVRERVPETDAPVLVCYRGAKRRVSVMTARYSGGAWRFNETKECQSRLDERVTHWATMPPPPLGAYAMKRHHESVREYGIHFDASAAARL